MLLLGISIRRLNSLTPIGSSLTEKNSSRSSTRTADLTALFISVNVVLRYDSFYGSQIRKSTTAGSLRLRTEMTCARHRRRAVDSARRECENHLK